MDNCLCKSSMGLPGYKWWSSVRKPLKLMGLVMACTSFFITTLKAKRHSIQEIDRFVHRTKKYALVSTFKSLKFLCSDTFVVCLYRFIFLYFISLSLRVSLLSLATLLSAGYRTNVGNPSMFHGRLENRYCLASASSHQRELASRKKSRRIKKMKSHP